MLSVISPVVPADAVPVVRKMSPESPSEPFRSAVAMVTLPEDVVPAPEASVKRPAPPEPDAMRTSPAAVPLPATIETPPPLPDAEDPAFREIDPELP